MSDKNPVFWFPAKQRGWGWGSPSTWQGRTFLALWLALVIPASPFLVQRGIFTFAVFLAVMISLLLVVCFIKGEPPKWRQ